MGKRFLLGVSGSVAALKAPFIVRSLRKRGFNVTCVLTRSAAKFITSFSLQNVSENRCYTDDDFWSESNLHIQLCKQADYMLVYPASAHTLATCACGLADNLLSNCMLAFEGPVMILPAMHTEMIENRVVQDNIARCRELGMLVLGPGIGDLLSKDSGSGRVVEPDTVASLVDALDYELLDLSARSVLVSVGGTTEPIDSVRLVSNASSGKMGTMLAHLLALYNADVHVVSTVDIENVGFGSFKRVTTAESMHAALKERAADVDSLIMAAAVSDFIPEKKLLKIRRGMDPLVLQFKPGLDILSALTHEFSFKTTVGFCLQDALTDEDIPLQKCNYKKCDYIIANTAENFGNERRSLRVYSSEACLQELTNVSVFEAAREVIKLI